MVLIYLVDDRFGLIECPCILHHQQEVPFHFAKTVVHVALDFLGNHLHVNGILDDLIVLRVFLKHKTGT